MRIDTGPYDDPCYWDSLTSYNDDHKWGAESVSDVIELLEKFRATL